MKHWGTLLVINAVLTGIVSSVAFAAPQVPGTEAMPVAVEENKQLAGTETTTGTSTNRVFDLLETEKAKLTLDMDQANEKLEARIYELKTQTLTTTGFKKRYQLNQKIQKLEDQQSSINKMQHKISKSTNGTLADTKRSWDKLKNNIDKQLSLL